MHPEYVSWPSPTLSALLTVEGGVRVSLSSTCQLSSEQGGLDGEGRALREYLRAERRELEVPERGRCTAGEKAVRRRGSG